MTRPDGRDIPSGPEVWPAAPGWWTRQGTGLSLRLILVMVLMMFINIDEHDPNAKHTRSIGFYDQVVEPLWEGYPEDFVRFDTGERPWDGSFSIYLYGESNEGIEDIVDGYVRYTSGADVDAVTNLGYRRSELRDLERSIEAFLMDSDGILVAEVERKLKWNQHLLKAWVYLDVGVPSSFRMDSLVSEAQQMIYDRLGEHTMLEIELNIR